MEETKSKTTKRRLWFWLLFLSLLGVLIFSGVKLWGIYSAYHKGDQVQQELLQYKPEITDAPSGGNPDGIPEKQTENQGLIELQGKYPDVCGWLTIDDTNIDYVFARGKSNDTYLRRTLDGEYLVSGTLFLDYRNAPDLSDFNSIVYGHHMKNGSMFADLLKFASGSYFEAHKTGFVFLPYTSYSLEIIAYLVVDRSDSVIYDPHAEKDELLEYIRENARQHRDVKLSAKDTLLTLSTCNYEYDGARSVVVARVAKEG